MEWERGRRSDNVVEADDDGGNGGGGGFRVGGGTGLGIGGVAVVLVISLFTGINPLQLLGQMSGGGSVQHQAPPPREAHTSPAAKNPQTEFVRAILGDTEDTWGAIFRASGKQYRDPTLVLFNGGVNSACGYAQSAVGPFYCPGDQRVYLDLSFFHDMETRFAASGDFARAYVIAHEVGHHVQRLLGTSAKVDQARQRGARMEGANGLSVRLELQADCYAGVWANNAQQRLHWLQPGDLESALRAATAIGDDRLQQQSRGQVVPDAFTHGSSAQRVKWFSTGYDKGDPGACDTFAAKQL
ncbi:MAG TPA: neutral zinc metallopeptidase [Ideonella sp.]|uniref:KPN_02809 family neutral zinc metallopeptidase n=1 Tax=Ideonella sp. TaxID=1929293 RepID=UPI002C6D601C|nr:neutral zinc metallopeptidase [Ideonella sp.]HSI49849.1 neutral zinc metallopeptidase [Ideonella sp.]